MTDGTAGRQVRVELRVRGLVQGVYFRASAQQQAIRLGLVGWVKNEADGSVSACVEGSPETVEAFVAWCHRGPAAARVDAVDAAWSDAKGGLDRFFVRP